jgi:hypothetical protein
MFEKELKFFVANQDRLVAEYPGQTIVIRGSKVTGAYPSALEAYLEASARFEPGTFMIQPCEPGPGAYTATLAPAP